MVPGVGTLRSVSILAITAGPWPARNQGENLPDNRGGFGIFLPAAVFICNIAIDGLAAQAFPGGSLCPENCPDFLLVSRAYHSLNRLAQRGKIIFPLFAVHAIVHRNEMDVVLQERTSVYIPT